MNILGKLWKSSPEQVFRSVRRRLFTPPKNEQEFAEWLTIERGIAKGITLFVNPDKFEGWQDMLSGTYDEFLFDAIAPLSNWKNKTIWDVGAHFGFNSLVFAKIVGGDQGKVIAFEPNTHNIEHFKKHQKRNKMQHIMLFDKALGATNGLVSFMISDDVEGSKSTGSHIKGVLPSQEDEAYITFIEERVEVVKADDLIDSQTVPIPDLIKLDVEGAEADVLRGAYQLLQEHKPVLLIEVHHIEAMHDVLRILLPLKYETQIIERASLSRCFIIAK
ncbi:MAG: FkbM family methyltransferase [Bernardetiaceae bacterium]|nr:FkbM family methyltransferase [Bernardetiaceae bacterium]